MAGIFDMFGNLSPEQQQGLLAAAAQLSQASGPSRTPTNLAAGLANAGMAYSGSIQQGRERKQAEERQAQQDAMSQEYRTAQMDGIKGQQAAREAESQRRAGMMKAAQESIVDGQLNPQLYAQKLAQYDPEAAIDLMKQSAPKPVSYGQPKEFLVNGKPAVVVVDSEGKPKVLDGYSPYEAPKVGRSGGGGGGGSGGSGGMGGGNGKAPSGYRWNAAGELEAIPGGPASLTAKLAKAPTEFQGKSAVYGARAEESDRIVSSLKYDPKTIAAKTSVEDTWLVGGALGAAVNSFAMSPSDQKAEQAQRDFINAVLRQESGAAIGKDEFTNARRQYFPEVGDGPEKLAQKARNRKIAIQGLKQNAGPAAYTAAPAAAGAVRRYNPATGKIE